MKKEFDNINRTVKSKPLVKASEVKVDPISRPPMKKMMKFMESSDPPAFLQKKEGPKSRDKTPSKPTPPGNPDEIYEEDFDDFVEEERKPAKVGKKQASHMRSDSPDYSLETLKRELEKENALALKREEDILNESAVVQFSSQALPTETIDAKMIAKQQKRNKEVLNFVKLEKEGFSFFELLPMSQFDNLTTKIQTGDLKNVAAQCNDDNVEKEVQCVEIITKDAVAQWPGDYSSDMDQAQQASSINKFLSRVSPMIEILLEENLDNRPNKVNIKKSEGTAGEIISQISIPAISFMKGRFPEASLDIKDLIFFPTKKNFLCGLYNLSEKGSLIVIWDILNPSKPNRFLYSPNEITSICMSASKEHIVIAGNSIGSIELWDMREAGSNHEIYKVDEKKKVSIRSPTYSTDSIEMYTHEGRIQKIIEMPAAKGENFSILVSDSEGNLVTWTVIEMMNSDIEEIDFGLRVGGRVKLVKSHRASIRDLLPKCKTSACSCIALDQSDGQKFLFASPNYLMYGNRFGMDIFPSIFSKFATDINSISFSKFNEYQYFIVGYSCGTISLYDKHFSNPVANWVESLGSVIKVAWDVTERCGFFSLDKDQNLAVWDLKKVQNGPLSKTKIDTPAWTAVDWVIPESSKHSMILAVAYDGEIRIINLK